MGNRFVPMLREHLGARGLVIVLLAPVIAAAITAALTPTLITSNTQASATVQIYPAIGTHAAYEVSSYVADFTTAYTGAAAQAKGAEAAGTAAGLATALREGDNAGAAVSFTAPTAEAATKGLRATAAEALRQVVQADLDRASLAVEAAKQSLQGTSSAFDALAAGSGLSTKNVESARATALAQGAQRIQSAIAEQATTRAALHSIPDLVAGTTVSTSVLSTTTNQIRVIATAAVSAFVIALLVVLLVRRRARAGLATDPSRA